VTPTIETLKLTQLEEDPRNPNYMSEEQLELLSRGIQENGFLQPVLVRRRDDGTYVIIDGHHRALAAGRAGLAEVPCVVVHTNTQQAAIVQIAMNKVRGELNLGEVSKILNELHVEGYSTEMLSLSGFSSDELETLFASAQPEDAEDVLAGVRVTNNDDEDDPAPEKPFILELTFSNRADLDKAKRGLKKVLGKGHELSAALLHLLEQQ